MSPGLGLRGVGWALASSIALASVGGCAHRADAGAAARQALVEASLWELSECWDEVAQQHPGAAGSLLLQVDLRPKGSVEWVAILVDEFGIPKLSACVVQRVKRWRFPQDTRRRSIQFGVGFTGPSAASSHGERESSAAD